MKSKLKKAFTLVELVVVIAVIAILAAISVGAYFGITNTAKDSKLLQQGKQIYSTLVIIGSENNTYNELGLYIDNKDNIKEDLSINTGINYYITFNTDDISNNEDTIIFINSNNNDDSNLYDYFRYFVKEDINRYIEISLLTGEHTFNNNEEINVEPQSFIELDNEDFNKTPVAIFTMESNENVTTNYRGDLINESNNEFYSTINDYVLTIKEYSNAKRNGDSYGYDVLYLTNANGLSYIKFDVPSDIKSVGIEYARYSSNFAAKLNINGYLTREENKIITTKINKVLLTNPLNNEVTISTTVEQKHAVINTIYFFK